MEDELWRRFLVLDAPDQHDSIGLIGSIDVVVIGRQQQLGELSTTQRHRSTKRLSIKDVAGLLRGRP